MTKTDSKICPTLNKPSHNRLRLLKYCQNAENSPHLVTLWVRKRFKFAPKPSYLVLVSEWVREWERERERERKGYVPIFAIFCILKTEDQKGVGKTGLQHFTYLKISQTLSCLTGATIRYLLRLKNWLWTWSVSLNCEHGCPKLTLSWVRIPLQTAADNHNKLLLIF